MCPPVFRPKQDVRENVEECQSDFLQIIENVDIGTRLLAAFKKACGTDSKKFIAEKLGFKTDKAVYKVIKGETELSFDHLRNFRNSTKHSIDWLLTGEGPQLVSDIPGIVLTEPERKLISKLAESLGKDFEEMLHRLVREALFTRGSEMFAHFYDLSAENLRELTLLYSLVIDEEKGAAQQNTSSRLQASR